MENKLYFNSPNINYKWMLDRIEKEKNYVGYYSLPWQNIDNILRFVNGFDRSIESVVVLGIGGSSLGTKAIYEFLKPVQRLKRKLLFIETTDPIYISNLLKSIDIKKSHFLVISKSGSTIETISIFKYLYALNPNGENYTFITDKNSNLDRFAQTINSNIFYVPQNVGGRFSVLSVVGLVPLALLGVDIEAILDGAKDIYNSFFKEDDLRDTILKKAIFYAKNYERYNINCLFVYLENLKYFTEWFVQLWAESLGKRQKGSVLNVGLTPIGLVGPRDQHSFLQLIMEGKRDKSVTFIRVDKFVRDLDIPNISLEHLKELDIVNGINFGDLINLQSKSVMEGLLREEDIPIDEITISNIDAKSIGELMFYYELLTSVVALFLDVEAYDQPGVEIGKRILKDKL